MVQGNTFDACDQIRKDWSDSRMDAGKGKKRPGGYWIPASKQCAKKGGGKGRKAALVAGLAAGAVGAGAYTAAKLKSRKSSGTSAGSEATPAAPSTPVLEGAPTPSRFPPSAE